MRASGRPSAPPSGTEFGPGIAVGPDLGHDASPAAPVRRRPRPLSAYLRLTRSYGSRLGLGLVLMAATLLAACSSGASAPEPSASEVEWVRSVMEDSYLYADRVPKADLSGLTQAEQALEALRVDPPDRFSYVDVRSRYVGFFDEGRALGLGIGFRLIDDTLVLRFVQPDSPAGRAGLARGDRVEAIDGTAIAELVAQDQLLAALGPTEPGVAVRLAIARGDARREVRLVKDWYTVAPILARRVIERDGERIGYVALYAFTEPARADWNETLAALRAEDVRRLVVDLRDNGGGRLFVAAEIAGSLAPPAAIGETFATLVHNARRTRDDLTIVVPTHPATGAFEQVAWLVSDASCSASEVLIAGLRPFRDDALIGTPSCGKPVGFEPQTRDDLVLSAVSFATRNRDGFGDWFDGLAPTCTVSAEPHLPYGDEADPRLAEALHWLGTGACRAAPEPVTAAAASKSIGRKPMRARGLAGETGLH
jgi:C-terminal processing protease CtpA/Prc